jgi:hypothetical protein
VYAVLTWLPKTMALQPVVASHPSIDMAHRRDPEVFFLAAMPRLNDTVASFDSRPARSDHPKRDFAGPQEIISLLPDATNNVQTVLQPDLVAPTKLANPVRVQSMLPARAVPLPPAAQFQQPPLNPQEPSTVPASEHQVESPASLLVAPERSLAVAAESAPSKITATAPGTNPPAAVVVIDAVSVPPEPIPVIPAGELVGHFVVGPSQEQGFGNAKPALPSYLTTESGTGTQSGSVLDFGIAVVKERPAAIAILGGTPGRNGREVAATSSSRNSYGLTIISAGTNGGASRDLGVFSRSDRVYTVGIPMTDVGGGPDWSMEYALVNSGAGGDGLLTPPVPLKKIRATAANTDLVADAGPVFVTGVIDDKGKVETLRAIRPWEVRGQAAVNALARWEFSPAHLNGRPVVCRVLFGVAVIPAEEVGIQ